MEWTQMYEHVKATHSLLVQFISKMPCSHPCTMTPESHVMNKYTGTYKVSPTHDVYKVRTCQPHTYPPCSNLIHSSLVHILVQVIPKSSVVAVLVNWAQLIRLWAFYTASKWLIGGRGASGYCHRVKPWEKKKTISCGCVKPSKTLVVVA